MIFLPGYHGTDNFLHIRNLQKFVMASDEADPIPKAHFTTYFTNITTLIITGIAVVNSNIDVNQGQPSVSLYGINFKWTTFSILDVSSSSELRILTSWFE